jgi:hypothetical protein
MILEILSPSKSQKTVKLDLLLGKYAPERKDVTTQSLTDTEELRHKTVVLAENRNGDGIVQEQSVKKYTGGPQDC